MSNYKPETLPSGVLIRKIKGDEDEFVLSNSEQALIVTKRDIARMHGIVFPEIAENACKHQRTFTQDNGSIVCRNCDKCLNIID